MEDEEVKNKRGRPTKYEGQATIVAVEYMAKEGLTDKQMCKKLGITEPSFTHWKKEHDDFFTSLKSSKKFADDKVEKSLYKNAIGYTHTVEKPMSVSDGNGEGSHIENVKYREKIPAQTVAQIFWLKNRRPQEWRDKRDVELSGEVETSPKYDLSKLTPEELETFKSLVEKIELK